VKTVVDNLHGRFPSSFSPTGNGGRGTATARIAEETARAESTRPPLLAIFRIPPARVQPAARNGLARHTGRPRARYLSLTRWRLRMQSARSAALVRDTHDDGYDK